jgi:hypothetical protein
MVFNAVVGGWWLAVRTIKSYSTRSLGGQWEGGASLWRSGELDSLALLVLFRWFDDVMPMPWPMELRRGTSPHSRCLLPAKL